MKLFALALMLSLFNGLLTTDSTSFHEFYKINQVSIEDPSMENLQDEELIAEDTQTPKDTVTHMTFLGDVCFGTNFGNKGNFHRTYVNKGPDYFFSGVIDAFKNEDLVVANLENVFTNQQGYQQGKIFTYKADPMYIEILKNSGITHFGVVNNHMGDYLQAGFNESLGLLESNGFQWFGHNQLKTNSAELGSIQVDRKEIYEKEDLRIGLLAYNGFYESYATDAMIQEDVQYFKEHHVDYIVALLHWGGQNTNIVTPRQKEYGHKLIDMGIDLIIGGHPHALQEVEEYKGKRIYYSLGDFLFVHRSKPAHPDGVMVHLKLRKDKDGIIREEFSHTPVLWAGSKVSNTYRPVISTEEADIQRSYKILKLNNIDEF